MMRTYAVQFMDKHQHVLDTQYVTARNEEHAKVEAYRMTGILTWDVVEASSTGG